MGWRKEIWNSFPGERSPYSKTKRALFSHMPYMMAARPRIWGAERVEDVRAPNMRPVGSNRQAYQKTICTWIPNGYGDLRRRRLYIRLITIHACTELRRCKRSGVLRDAASSRSQCPHIYSTTQSASATAYSWRFAPVSHARFCSRPRPSTYGFSPQ